MGKIFCLQHRQRYGIFVLQSPSKEQRSTKGVAMRIAIGCIGHETNTFSPVATTLDNFTKRSYHRGDEIINAFRGPRTITGGSLMSQNNSIYNLFRCGGRLPHRLVNQGETMPRRNFLIKGVTTLIALFVINSCSINPQTISNSRERKENMLSSMKTLILVNTHALTKIYPQEALDIQQTVEVFARRHNAQVLDINQAYQAKTGQHLSVPAYPNAALTGMAKEIKAEIISQTDRQLDTLILVGDESMIPMWEIRLGDEYIHTDSFYTDLDGNGLPEVATTRVLGNPEAMKRQLNTAAEIGGPEATILCSEDTRIHLETQRFLDTLAQQGHHVTVLGRGGSEQLPASDLIIHFGHGSPQRLSNRFGETFVSAKGMPALKRHPIAIVDGCATTPPGSALLRAFLNNGCRAYIGSTATVWGMIPARYANQLVIHFLDAYEMHPEWSIAKLLTVARAKYIDVTRLSEMLLALEESETLSVSGDTHKHLMTFLGWHAYGAPFARLHQDVARTVFTKRPLVKDRIPLTAKKQNAVEATFALASGDGQPILFFRAEWLNSISDSLTLRIQQNGETIHKLQGDAHIIYQRIKDICVGGYVDGELYHAYWLLPLERKVGQNHLRVEIASSSAFQPLFNVIRSRQNQVQSKQANSERGLRILPESVIEIWPEWETIEAPEK